MCGYFVLVVRMGFLFFFIEANIFLWIPIRKVRCRVVILSNGVCQIQWSVSYQEIYVTYAKVWLEG